MRTIPSVSQLLGRAALTAIAVVVVLAAGDLSERQFGLPIPRVIHGTVLFLLFVVMPIISFRQAKQA
ncbi:MAG: hypothetical protein MUC36_17385 [Planctomycetes bacterium]|jgi:putative effector of murein hydrolase LrgA (UPF0299 family)|nr:hypothetical protein [Planctomycetota bacterium]